MPKRHEIPLTFISKKTMTSLKQPELTHPWAKKLQPMPKRNEIL
jgi:hypothetical protein